MSNWPRGFNATVGQRNAIAWQYQDAIEPIGVIPYSVPDGKPCRDDLLSGQFNRKTGCYEPAYMDDAQRAWLAQVEAAYQATERRLLGRVCEDAS